MQFKWNGNDGFYTDAANWTPAGVPLWDGGASALIESGTVTLSDAEPNAISITLSGPDAATQPNLVLDNAALGPDVSLGLTPPSTEGRFVFAAFATLTIDGYDTSQATIYVGGGRGGPGPQFLTIAIAPYGQLNQEGTINLSLGTLLVNGTGQAPATLNNDGAINVLGTAILSTDGIGSGTIAFLPNSTTSGLIEFGGAVSATQHVSFNKYTAGGIRIDDPSAFHGVLDGFDGFDGSPDGSLGSVYKVTLADTQATGTYFAQTTPDAGVLLVLNGQEVVGALTVTGKHGPHDFGFFSSPDGSTTLT